MKAIVAIAFLITAMVSCEKNPSGSLAADTKTDVEKSRDALGTVTVGMTESNVLRIMGKPDEVRTKGEMGYIEEKYRWVYGIERPGEFPMIGSVCYDANDKVFMTSCPSRGIHRQMDMDLHISDSPQKTDSGLYCLVDNFSIKDDLHQISVSIVNDGENPFLYRHDNTGIHHSVLIEIFNESKALIWRLDHAGFHSPQSFDRNDWRVLQVDPKMRATETVSIFLPLVPEDGVFSPGTYFIRASFPLEEGKLFQSNLLEFKLSEPANIKR